MARRWTGGKSLLGLALWWRQNGCHGVSNLQPHDCLLNSLFGRRSKKISKFRVTGLCVGNSPWTDEFPVQMASNAENVSIWWRHHECWPSPPTPYGGTKTKTYTRQWEIPSMWQVFYATKSCTLNVWHRLLIYILRKKKALMNIVIQQSVACSIISANSGTLNGIYECFRNITPTRD